MTRTLFDFEEREHRRRPRVSRLVSSLKVSLGRGNSEGAPTYREKPTSTRSPLPLHLRARYAPTEAEEGPSVSDLSAARARAREPIASALRRTYWDCSRRPRRRSIRRWSDVPRHPATPVLCSESSVTESPGNSHHYPTPHPTADG